MYLMVDMKKIDERVDDPAFPIAARHLGVVQTLDEKGLLVKV